MIILSSRAVDNDVLMNENRYLITPQPRPRNINDVMPMIGARFYSQLDATHLRNDVLEHALSRVSRLSRVRSMLSLWLHFECRFAKSPIHVHKISYHPSMMNVFHFGHNLPFL